MSILDLGFTTGEELVAMVEKGSLALEGVIDLQGFADSNMGKLIQAGYSGKEIYDLSDSEMDALFQTGYQALGAGDYTGARAIFTKLAQLDQLDARFPFALGATLRLQGELGKAAKCYLLAISLNAIWPEAFVRLGECLMLAGELDYARDALEEAIEQAGEHKHGATARSEAKALLAKIAKSEDVH
ncbi:hypothetical protein [Labrenzia sp. OB1]|uniref:hypothetical protein n=1 Tax=Labrenzia sp. OB1 TaxID=1561204 RepID=UPI000B154704|nr:hypothetical protein [Labrenzia sp. OB1]